MGEWVLEGGHNSWFTLGRNGGLRDWGNLFALSRFKLYSLGKWMSIRLPELQLSDMII